MTEQATISDDLRADLCKVWALAACPRNTVSVLMRV